MFIFSASKHRLEFHFLLLYLYPSFPDSFHSLYTRYRNLFSLSNLLSYRIKQIWAFNTIESLTYQSKLEKLTDCIAKMRQNQI
jgi:hypothetical protein